MAKPAKDEVLFENDAEFDAAVTLEDEAMALWTPWVCGIIDNSIVGYGSVINAMHIRLANQIHPQYQSL